MLTIVSEGRAFKVMHVWFAEEFPMNVPKGIDRLMIHGYPHDSVGNGCNAEISLQHTLITNLTEPEEEIRKRFKSNTRNEINRAVKDGTKIVTYASPDLCSNPSVLSDFARMYCSMYEHKGMGKELNIKELTEYIKKDGLVISEAYIEDKPVVFHSYVTDGKRCRFLQSCSEFRIQEPVLRSAVGRANRLLHWEDMLYFKTHNCLEYDWGGVFAYEGDNGIDSFKKGFGGSPKDYYNIMIAISNKAKVWDVIKKRKKQEG